MNCKEKEIKNTHICNLKKIFEDSLLDPKTVTIISNASIKNNVATLILHICFSHNILAKSIHHAIIFTSTEAELFAIRCGINQAVQVLNITCIIIITDTIHSARQIFNSSFYPYQLQSIAISQDFRAFFNKNSNNSIAFWNCPSSVKWTHHSVVDKEIQHFNCILNFPCKLSWDFSKKEEYDLIIQKWQMYFHGAWLKLPGHLNSLCVRVTRVITNHTPICKYHLRFLPRENFNCPCRSYPIESRHHILHECSMESTWTLGYSVCTDHSL